MNILKEQEIGQFVAQDFRTAAVFSTYGIDFCCRGNRSLQNVCDKNGIVIEDIIDELQQVVSTEANPSIDYKSWPIDLLATYIEKTHHKFVRSKIPVLLQFLHKLCDRHGENHPELLEIYSEFQNVSEELLEHMKKEENILFPQIIKMVSHMEENSSLPQSN